ENVQLLDFHFLNTSVSLDECHLIPFSQGTSVHPSDGDTANECVVVERSYLQLGSTFEGGCGRNYIDDGVQQESYILSRCFPVGAHPALFRRTVDSYEVQLVFRSTEVKHKVENRLLHFIRPAVFLIHLVNHYDGFE